MPTCREAADRLPESTVRNRIVIARRRSKSFFRLMEQYVSQLQDYCLKRNRLKIGDWAPRPPLRGYSNVAPDRPHRRERAGRVEVVAASRQRSTRRRPEPVPSD